MSLMKEINEIASSPKELRKFGLTMGIAFGLIGGLTAWRGHEAVWPWFAALAGFFLLFGFVWPTGLKPVQKAWMTLALLMGFVMSRVILTVLFYLAFAPIGIILRLMGKDLLDMKRDRGETSYWKAHKARSKEDYENQF